MSLKALCRGLLAVAALAASAGSALAQDVPVVATGGGLYFKEIAKDGRIYVFNSPAEAERFEKSGETGRAITKIGVGPNGETVVGDSETALELFFFKHGLSEKVDRPKQPVQTIVWRDGKTRFTLGNNFYMEMSNRIQPRFTFEQPDDNVRLAGTAAAGDTQEQLPHPAREVQARGLVLQARARVRGPAQLGGRHGRPAEPLRRGREHRLGRREVTRRSASASASSRRPTAASSSPRRARSSSWTARSWTSATTRAARRVSRCGARSGRTSSTGAP